MPIIFRHIEKEDLKMVVDFELAKITGRLADRGYELTLTADAKEFLIKKGTNLDYGARPLRRALENFVEDQLTEELLRGTFTGTNRIRVDDYRDYDSKMKRLNFEGEIVDPPKEESAEEAVGGAG